MIPFLILINKNLCSYRTPEQSFLIIYCRRFSFVQLWYDLISHRNSKIDKPAEALPYIRSAITADIRRLEPLLLWRRIPYDIHVLSSAVAYYITFIRGLFSQYSEALSRTGMDDNETKLSSEKIIATEGDVESSGQPQIVALVRSWVFLARVLRPIGQEEQAKDQYVDDHLLAFRLEKWITTTVRLGLLSGPVRIHLWCSTGSCTICF